MHKISLFLLGIVFLLPGFAQELSLHSAAEGVFIQVPDFQQAYEEFDLYRSKKGRFRKIASLSAPENQATFTRRYHAHKGFFPLPLRKEQESLDMVWQFIVNKQQPERLAVFRHPAIQIAMGMAYLDQEAEGAESYQYRLEQVSSLNQWNGQLLYEPHALAHEDFTSLQSSRDKEFPHAEWIALASPEIMDFEVWRRPVGEREFLRVYPLRIKAQENDSLRLIMTDTTAKREGIFEYYVVPLDLLGNRGLPSQRLQSGNFSTRTQPTIYNFQVNGQRQDRALRLSWSLFNPRRVRSLRLYRSRDPQTAFALVRELGPLDTIYLDPVDEPGEAFFYYLEINDITGKNLKSATNFGIYKGKHEAAVPVNLSASTQDQHVLINWQSHDEDVRGYYVYRANGHRGELSQVSAFIPASEKPSYLDTARFNKGQIYSYAVRVESKSYTLGPLSERVAIRKQIETSISPPLHIQSQFQEKQVRVSWENLYARNAYVIAYQLYRRTVAAEAIGSWQIVNEEAIPAEQNYCYDREIEAGKTYEYAVKVQNGLGAESSLSKTSRIQIPIPAFPQFLTLRRQPNGISLRWPRFEASFPYQTMLQRSNEAGEVIELGPNDREAFQLLDQAVQKGNYYSYRLLYLDMEGQILSSTDAFSIRY